MHIQIETFTVGGQQAYVQKGVTGIWVHDDQGSLVKLRPNAQYNWVEFAVDGVVVKVTSDADKSYFGH